MDISLVEKSLDDLGIEFTRTGEVLNVKLGGYSNKVKISYNSHKQKLNYSYYQPLMIFISLLSIVLSMMNLGSQEFLMSGFQLAMALGLLTNVIITEIKVTDLRRCLREHNSESKGEDSE